MYTSEIDHSFARSPLPFFPFSLSFPSYSVLNAHLSVGVHCILAESLKQNKFVLPLSPSLSLTPGWYGTCVPRHLPPAVHARSPRPIGRYRDATNVEIIPREREREKEIEQLPIPPDGFDVSIKRGLSVVSRLLGRGLVRQRLAW